MAKERLTMRKIKEALRLKYTTQLPYIDIGRSCGVVEVQSFFTSEAAYFQGVRNPFRTICDEAEGDLSLDHLEQAIRDGLRF